MATDTPTATLVHRTLRNRARRALLALAADAAAVEAHREHPTAASRAGLPSPTQLVACAVTPDAPATTAAMRSWTPTSPRRRRPPTRR